MINIEYFDKENYRGEKNKTRNSCRTNLES